MIAPYRDTATHTPRPPTDPDAIGASWDAMTEPGHVYEVRVLTKGRAGPLGLRGTPSGYFTDRHAYIDAVRAIRGDDATGVYLTMNPVDPALLTRAPNRLATRVITATRDEEITARRRFLIDIDAANGADESATDDERTTALARRDEIHTFLQEVLGWGPARVVTSSGNGGGLIFAIDLPNDEQARHLIKRALQALHARFTTPAATVDVANSNAARITRIPGTVTAKGTHTPERPWRRATATYPDATRVVTRAQLEALAALAPVAAGGGGHPTAARRSDAERDTGLPVDTEGECYARLLEEGSPAGQRHHDMTRLVGHYLARGLGTREIAVLLRPWVDRCQPPFPYAQLDAVIRDLAAAEARKRGRGDDDRDEGPSDDNGDEGPSDDNGDEGPGPGHAGSPPTGGAAARELIATQRAELADVKAQVRAWEQFFLNRAIPDKAKRVFVHMHKRAGVPIGRPLPDVMPRWYADEQDIAAEGIARSAYHQGRDVLLSLGLVTREQVMKTAPPLDAEMDREEASAKTPRRQRSRGKDWFYVWGLDGRAVNAFWPQLPTLVEIAPTERQLKVIESRTASLEKAIAEEKPTRQVVAALKRDVRQERQERVKVASECQALTFERDNARDEALAVARERDRALQEAQRIIHENQRAPIMLGCTGCGQRIDLATWRCDDCRAREHEAAGHSMFDVNLESHSAHTVSVTNRFTSNIESADTVLRPCAGGCGTPTHRGWTCKPCRDRSTDSLHISDCTTQGPGPGPGPGQEALHGR